MGTNLPSPPPGSPACYAIRTILNSTEFRLFVVTRLKMRPKSRWDLAVAGSLAM